MYYIEDFKQIPSNMVKSDGNGNTQVTITEDKIYKNYFTQTLYLSNGVLIAYIAWIGTSLSSGERLFQPAIVNNNTSKSYLSYDGRANYIKDSDLIVMPNKGVEVPMEKAAVCYFNDKNPGIPNKDYSLDLNNKSIRMNNISIYNEDFSKGVMLDFRASMEGAFSSETKNGYVIILSAVDAIN